MTYRTNKKELTMLVTRLNDITGNPQESYSVIVDENGTKIISANIGNYHLDFAYGGVSLSQIVSEGGGTRYISTCGKVTKAALATWIRAYIAGIELIKNEGK
jgi:hypothetical protein